ncbi:hypothetical protein THAOC_10460, partial [Thalassiosira oceanica]
MPFQLNSTTVSSRSGAYNNTPAAAAAPWPNEGNSTQKERCLAFEYDQFVDESKHAATEGDEDE